MLPDMGWGAKFADWALSYVLRERRHVTAYTTSLQLLTIQPPWHQHLQITYQNLPITGFFWHQAIFKNRGNRAVQDLPFQMTASPGSLVVWPFHQPQGAVQNLQTPTPNQLTGTIGFVNPREEVIVSFWAFNDTVGSLVVTARAPDVEFSTEPWRAAKEVGYRIGLRIHQVSFWIGTLVILGAVSYGLYTGVKFLFKYLRANFGI